MFVSISLLFFIKNYGLLSATLYDRVGYVGASVITHGSIQFDVTYSDLGAIKNYLDWNNPRTLRLEVDSRKVCEPTRETCYKWGSNPYRDTPEYDCECLINSIPTNLYVGRKTLKISYSGYTIPITEITTDSNNIIFTVPAIKSTEIPLSEYNKNMEATISGSVILTESPEGEEYLDVYQSDYSQNNNFVSSAFQSFVINHDSIIKKIEVYSSTNDNMGKIKMCLHEVGDPYPIYCCDSANTGTNGYNKWTSCSLNYNAKKGENLFIKLIDLHPQSGYAGSKIGYTNKNLYSDGKLSIDASPVEDGDMAFKVWVVLSEECVSHAYSECYDNDRYWYDSCGNREEKREECGTGGCRDDSCVGECTDSDGGKNYNVKGTVTAGDISKTDYCRDDVLVEYYCAGTEYCINEHTCKYGCVDGACVAPSGVNVIIELFEMLTEPFK
jgi:hypothetical protein